MTPPRPNARRRRNSLACVQELGTCFIRSAWLRPFFQHMSVVQPNSSNRGVFSESWMDRCLRTSPSLAFCYVQFSFNPLLSHHIRHSASVAPTCPGTIQQPYYLSTVLDVPLHYFRNTFARAPLISLIYHPQKKRRQSNRARTETFFKWFTTSSSLSFFPFLPLTDFLFSMFLHVLTSTNARMKGN